MRIVRATRASALVMVLVTSTGFAGGGGWSAGRTPAAHAPSDASNAAAPAAAAAVASHEHHAHHAPTPAAHAKTASHHHGHDCENGICRCDSRCPPRRSGPCGGALRPCSGGGQEPAAGPGPVRPFLLSAFAVLAPTAGRLEPQEAVLVPLTRSLDPFSPPPRVSSL